MLNSTDKTLINIIHNVFLHSEGISLSNTIECDSDTILEKVKGEFKNTNTPITIEISKELDCILVSFQLEGDTELSEDDKSTCIRLINKLNDNGISFYIDNEKDTFNFDECFFPELHQEHLKLIEEEEKSKQLSKKINNIELLPIINNSSFMTWEDITNKMKELNMPAKLMNKIRVQKWHLTNKYGENYINYIQDYVQKEFKKFENA